MRETTERPEAVEAGTVKAVGTKVHDLVHETGLLLTDDSSYESMAGAVNPYGDALSSMRIVDDLFEWTMTAGRRSFAVPLGCVLIESGLLLSGRALEATIFPSGTIVGTARRATALLTRRVALAALGRIWSR